MNYGEYMTDESHDLEFDREVRYKIGAFRFTMGCEAFKRICGF